MLTDELPPFSLGFMGRKLYGVPEDQWLPECDFRKCHLPCHRVLGVSETSLPLGCGSAFERGTWAGDFPGQGLCGLAL